MEAIHIEHIVLFMNFKDLKGAIVEVSQWAAVGRSGLQLVSWQTYTTSGCQVIRFVG